MHATQKQKKKKEGEANPSSHVLNELSSLVNHHVFLQSKTQCSVSLSYFTLNVKLLACERILNYFNKFFAGKMVPMK